MAYIRKHGIYTKINTAKGLIKLLEAKLHINGVWNESIKEDSQLTKRLDQTINEAASVITSTEKVEDNGDDED